MLTGATHRGAAKRYRIGLVNHVVAAGRRDGEGAGARPADRPERSARRARGEAHGAGDERPRSRCRLADRGRGLAHRARERRCEGRPARLHRQASRPVQRHDEGRVGVPASHRSRRPRGRLPSRRSCGRRPPVEIPRPRVAASDRCLWHGRGRPPRSAAGSSSPPTRSRAAAARVDPEVAESIALILCAGLASERLAAERRIPVTLDPARSERRPARWRATNCASAGLADATAPHEAAAAALLARALAARDAARRAAPLR